MDENNVYIMLASALLSLLFFYIPGLKDLYDELSSQAKQLFMVTAIFIVVAVEYALRVYQGEILFGFDSLLEAITLFVVALAVNAGVYRSVRYIGRDKESQG